MLHMYIACVQVLCTSVGVCMMVFGVCVCVAAHIVVCVVTLSKIVCECVV